MAYEISWSMTIAGRVWTGLPFVVVEAVAPQEAALIEGRMGSYGLDALPIRYAGARGTFPEASALDVLEGRVTATRYRDAIVLIGPTAESAVRLVEIPHGVRRLSASGRSRDFMPPVEVVANAIHTILTGGLFRLPPRSISLSWNVLNALAIAGIFAYVRTRGLVLRALLLLPVAWLSMYLGAGIQIRWNYALEEWFTMWVLADTFLAGLASGLVGRFLGKWD